MAAKVRLLLEKNATSTRIYKPDSVGPTVPVGASNRLIIYLGEPSPTPSIDLPVPAATRKRRGDEQPRIRHIFDLSAPKVYPAPLVAQRAVVSYTPFSPLPGQLTVISEQLSAVDSAQKIDN